MHRERAAIEPKAKAPSQAATPTAPEVAPKEIQSAVPAQPATEAPAADAAGQKDMPDANAIASERNPNGKLQQPVGSGPQRRARGPCHERNAIERGRGPDRQNPSPRKRPSPSLMRRLPSKKRAEAEAETRRTPSQSRASRASAGGRGARPTIGARQSAAPTVANRMLTAFIWAPAARPWTWRWAIEGGNEVNVL